MQRVVTGVPAVVVMTKRKHTAYGVSTEEPQKEAATRGMGVSLQRIVSVATSHNSRYLERC